MLTWSLAVVLYVHLSQANTLNPAQRGSHTHTHTQRCDEGQWHPAAWLLGCRRWSNCYLLVSAASLLLCVFVCVHIHVFLCCFLLNSLAMTTRVNAFSLQLQFLHLFSLFFIYIYYINQKFTLDRKTKFFSLPSIQIQSFRHTVLLWPCFTSLAACHGRDERK